MKNSRIQIYDEINWGIPRDDSESGVYDAIIKVFKYWCSLHPRERMRMKLEMVIRDSNVNQLQSYNPNTIVEGLSQYMGYQFSLEMLVEEWWLVYDPKKQPRKIKSESNLIIPKRSPVPGALRHEVFNRDGYKCVECGATNQDVRLHVDHIIPVSQGGSNELDNLQTLCKDCNLAKSNRAWKGGE